MGLESGGPSAAARRFTTHLVVPGTQRRTAITATYLRALLRGVRVLSWGWVAACCQSGASALESDYEIMARACPRTLEPCIVARPLRPGPPRRFPALVVAPLLRP